MVFVIEMIVINKIRFYSIFDIYGNSHQEYIVGYPFSINEICTMVKSKGLKSQFSVKVFFRIAETVLYEYSSVIESVQVCKVVNQYASSEGAPFSLECPVEGIHIHPLSDIFEYKYPNTDNNLKLKD